MKSQGSLAGPDTGKKFISDPILEPTPEADQKLNFRFPASKTREK